jgi:hypothetical protein
VTPAGGFVVWQDNITDGDGLGISMMPVNGTLSGSGGIHHVNVQGAGDQQNPRVTLLQGGGAAFVWQGGPKESQRIYARFLSSSNTWLTSDVPVNTFTNNFQINPAVATLTNGNVVVVWSSLNEAGPGSMQDVYGRIFSPTGQPITGEFPINQYVNFNQRTPTVAALSNGGFVVAWVSEQQRVVAALSPGLITPGQVQNASIDIYARLYNGSGVAQGNEFVASSADSNPCANPDVAAGSGGGFMVTWDAFDMASPTTNSLDIYARSFTSAGAGSGGTVVRVNTHLYGDQYAPRISALGTDYLIVWTSLAQDGSREGVYGQFLHGDGSKVGGEFRVNTTTVGSQIQPVVVSDGSSQFLAIWSSFTGLQYGFDLYAQRYVNTQQPLEPMAAPFVYAPFTLSNGVYQPQLVVSWPALSGLSISTYEVYVDGAGTPTAATTSNVWTMTAADGLTTSATHSFQVNYDNGWAQPVVEVAVGQRHNVDRQQLSWNSSRMDGGILWLRQSLAGRCKCAIGSRRADPAPGLFERRQSAGSRHLAEYAVAQYAARPVPHVESAAGPDVSSEGEDEPHRLVVGRFRRAALCGGHQRFNLRRRQSGGLLPGLACALTKFV